jgi:hypothetical protein
MTDPNERPWFKGLNIGGILDKLFTGIRFYKGSIEEIIDDIKSIKKEYVNLYKKYFEGIGDVYKYKSEKNVIPDDSMLTIAHSSWMSFKNCFKRRQRPWVLLIMEYFPMEPLFLTPLRRTKCFINSFANLARICKEASNNWIVCTACHRKLFWRIFQTKDFEEMYIHYDNRELYCAHKNCKLYNVTTGLTLTDIVLPSKKATKAFIGPILRSEARRRKNYLSHLPEDLPRPSRWIRFWNKLTL